MTRDDAPPANGEPAASPPDPRPTADGASQAPPIGAPQATPAGVLQTPPAARGLSRRDVLRLVASQSILRASETTR